MVCFLRSSTEYALLYARVEEVVGWRREAPARGPAIVGGGRAPVVDARVGSPVVEGPPEGRLEFLHGVAGVLGNLLEVIRSERKRLE